MSTWWWWEREVDNSNDAEEELLKIKTSKTNNVCSFKRNKKLFIIWHVAPPP